MKNFLLLFLGLYLSACTTPPAETTAPRAAPEAGRAVFAGGLNDYWYQGTAEIATYSLQQARYGELRQGEAVLIQVSEDFLTDRQVKNDAYENPNSVGVLKTNLFRRFTTGIYDYSLMTSVFTPVQTDAQPRTLKVTTSAQDWCGQSYTQLNYRGGNAWDMELRSYFEREGDQSTSLPADFVEDEVFNRIRTGGDLPTGSFDVIPNTGYLLMTHQPYRAAAAEASLEEMSDSLRRYVIHYPSLERRFAVTFGTAPPHLIEGWTDTYPSRDTVLTTTATLRARRQEPYWQLNANADGPLRAKLGLK